MSKDQWIADHETIEEEYSDGLLERHEAEAELRQLGLDAPEIKQILDNIDAEQGEAAWERMQGDAFRGKEYQSYVSEQLAEIQRTLK